MCIRDRVIDVHLMITPTDPYLEAFAEAGADVITAHVESGPHIHRTLQTIRALGKQVGVTLNPGTPISALESVITLVDMVLIMSVNPGFGGQKFIPSALRKLAEVRRRIDASGRAVRLEIDGGVKLDNIKAIAAAGADTFVAGSAVFGGKDYAATIRGMHEQIEAAKG